MHIHISKFEISFGDILFNRTPFILRNQKEHKVM